MNTTHKPFRRIAAALALTLVFHTLCGTAGSIELVNRLLGQNQEEESKK